MVVQTKKNIIPRVLFPGFIKNLLSKPRVCELILVFDQKTAVAVRWKEKTGLWEVQHNLQALRSRSKLLWKAGGVFTPDRIYEHLACMYFLDQVYSVQYKTNSQTNVFINADFEK